MSTSYEKVKNNLFDPAFTPSADGSGILYLLLQVAETYDTTSAIDATNPFNDVEQKLIRAIPQDSPLRREALQLLESRKARYAAGQQ